MFGGTYTGSVIEAGGTNNDDAGSPTTSGTLHVYDLDSGEDHFRELPESALSGTYGRFTFNHLTGAWTGPNHESLTCKDGFAVGRAHEGLEALALE
jgi:hypothetical protein